LICEQLKRELIEFLAVRIRAPDVGLDPAIEVGRNLIRAPWCLQRDLLQSGMRFDSAVPADLCARAGQLPPPHKHNA
jgi:hypothetical protein